MVMKVFLDNAKVEDSGCRSLTSTPPERISDVRLALETSNGRPVGIPGCREMWSCDFVHRKKPCQWPDLPLANVRLLVVGCTLNSETIHIPDFILDDFVVVLLRVTTDSIPVASFWETVGCLLQLGMTPAMSMIGMSAGVDRCLSIIADAAVAMEAVKMTLSHFVAFCGAHYFFSYLHGNELFKSPQTRLVLMYHDEDTLYLMAQDNMRQGMLLEGFHVVASLSSRLGYTDLDVMADVACGVDAEREDVKVENRTMHEEGNHIDESHDEGEPWDVVNRRLLPMEVLPLPDLDCNPFAMFWIGNPIKLHHSATFHDKKDHACSHCPGKRSDGTMFVSFFFFNLCFAFPSSGFPDPSPSSFFQFPFPGIC